VRVSPCVSAPLYPMGRTGTARERDRGLVCVRLHGSDGAARSIAFILFLYFWHPGSEQRAVPPCPPFPGVEPVKITARFACYAGRFIAGAGISWAGV
jgi:hypothetical protein